MGIIASPRLLTTAKLDVVREVFEHAAEVGTFLDDLRQRRGAGGFAHPALGPGLEHLPVDAPQAFAVARLGFEPQHGLLDFRRIEQGH
jgi:hypothetical protein